MKKTTYIISKMDCPSDEQMIRMKLAHLPTIQQLAFDIPHRKLVVFHTETHEPIFKELDSLQFDTSLQESVVVENFSTPNTDQNNQKKLLWQVLVINFFFFLLEISTGFFAQSMGLVADSLDMLADSIVYALALIAVGKTAQAKKNVANFAGILQLILAIMGLFEVIRRFIGTENAPNFQTMIVISAMALIGNAVCLWLLQQSKNQEAHMQASMIFTSNDVIVNIGVIMAGGLVYLTHSKYPDLIIGTIVFLMIGNGSLKIFKLAK